MDVSNWPDPPVWEHWTLENPWPLALSLLLVTVGLIVHGIRRQSRPTVATGKFGVVLIISLVVTAVFVETDREFVTKRTTELLGELEKGRNVEKIMPFFDKDCDLLGVDYGELKELLRKSNNQNQLERLIVRQIRAHQPVKNTMRMYVSVLGKFQLGAGPAQSVLVWRRDKKELIWRIVGIEALFAAGREINHLGRLTGN